MRERPRWTHVVKERLIWQLILPDEIHDLLRWNDWIRAYPATAEFFDRRLAASGGRY